MHEDMRRPEEQRDSDRHRRPSGLGFMRHQSPQAVSSSPHAAGVLTWPERSGKTFLQRQYHVQGEQN